MPQIKIFIFYKNGFITLPETNGSPLKIGHPQKETSSSNNQLSGALAVSLLEGSKKSEETTTKTSWWFQPI